MKSVLFVCLGNICRSPTARALFDARLREAGLTIETDSAGVADYHIGKAPDPRSIRHAMDWGVDLSAERARQVQPADFHRFDAIFAMDRDNLVALQRLAPASATARVCLLMELAPDYGLDEVPDPYYGGAEGFERVLDMLSSAADGLIEALQSSQSGSR